MYTLVDFMTHVKGIEYILSLLFIAGFLLFWEVLKPRPFASVVRTGKDDFEYVKMTGARQIVKNVGKIAAAPFIGLLYVALLPIGFLLMLLAEAVTLAVKGGAALLGKDVSFQWRPMEAYLAGRKGKKSARKAGGK